MINFPEMISDFLKYKYTFEKHSKDIISLLKREFQDEIYTWEAFGTYSLNDTGIIIKRKDSKEKYSKRARVLVCTNLNLNISLLNGVEDNEDLESEIIHSSSSYPLYSDDIEKYISKKILSIKEFLRDV
ncbi:MAG: hypothetical protein U0469_02220 [Candidatus Paceibacterota bacterium]|jgi:hypothetical protein